MTPSYRKRRPYSVRKIGPYTFNFYMPDIFKSETIIELVEDGEVIWKSKQFKSRVMRKWIAVAQAFLVGRLEGLKERTLATIFNVTR